MKNNTTANLFQPIATLILLAFSFCLSAQQSEVISQMQKLEVLTGKWQLVVDSSFDGGQTWQSTAPVEISIELGHKGRLLKEVPVTPLEKGFNMEAYLSYDQYRKVFRKAAVDDVWGIMDIYEGTIEGENLVMTNLKAGTTFPIGEGVWRAFRLTIELKADERKMIIDASDDGGAHWKPAFIARYKKAS